MPGPQPLVATPLTCGLCPGTTGPRPGEANARRPHCGRTMPRLALKTASRMSSWLRLLHERRKVMADCGPYGTQGLAGLGPQRRRPLRGRAGKVAGCPPRRTQDRGPLRKEAGSRPADAALQEGPEGPDRPANPSPSRARSAGLRPQLSKPQGPPWPCLRPPLGS